MASARVIGADRSRGLAPVREGNIVKPVAMPKMPKISKPKLPKIPKLQMPKISAARTPMYFEHPGYGSK